MQSGLYDSGHDFYKLLGIDPAASADEIKKVYRKLAFDLHPDRNGGDKAASAHFEQVVEAYETLKDQGKRQEYDDLRLAYFDALGHEQRQLPPVLRLNRQLVDFGDVRIGQGISDQIVLLYNDGGDAACEIDPEKGSFWSADGECIDVDVDDPEAWARLVFCLDSGPDTEPGEYVELVRVLLSNEFGETSGQTLEVRVSIKASPQQVATAAPDPLRRKSFALATIASACVIFAIIAALAWSSPKPKPRFVPPSSVVGVIDVGETPMGLAVSPDSKRVYVSHGPSLRVIDTATKSLAAPIEGSDYFQGGVVVNRDGKTAYASNGKGTVSVVDTALGIVVNTIAVGYGPTSLALSMDGARLFVCHHSLRPSVTILDTASRTIIGSVRLAGFPSGIAVAPDGLHVYTATFSNWDSPGWVSIEGYSQRS